MSHMTSEDVSGCYRKVAESNFTPQRVVAQADHGNQDSQSSAASEMDVGVLLTPTLDAIEGVRAVLHFKYPPRVRSAQTNVQTARTS